MIFEKTRIGWVLKNDNLKINKLAIQGLHDYFLISPCKNIIFKKKKSSK
jgi:hypothetical protein